MRTFKSLSASLILAVLIPVTASAQIAEGPDAAASAREFARGVGLFDAARYEEALEAFLRAAANPDDYETSFNVGVTYQKLGRHDEAAAAYRRALDVRPSYTKASVRLCSALVEAGRGWEAVEACGAAARARADDPDLYFDYGRAFAAVGLFDMAEDTFKKSIRFRPDFAAAHLELGLAQRQLGEYRDALDSLERAVRLSGGGEAAKRACQEVTDEMDGLDKELSAGGGYLGLLRLGDGYRLKGWFARAAAVYRYAGRVNPKDAKAPYLEGLSYYGMNQYYRAVGAYERAVALDPSAGEARRSLEWLNRFLLSKGAGAVAAR